MRHARTIVFATMVDGTHDDALRTVGGGRKLYGYRYAGERLTAVLTRAQAAQLAQAAGVMSVESDVAAPLEFISPFRGARSGETAWGPRPRAASARFARADG